MSITQRPLLVICKLFEPCGSATWFLTEHDPVEKYGSHSLRKTFGYHMRVQHKVSIPILMQIFNHHSQKQTLDYLCVQPDEIKEVYMLGVG